MKTFSFNSIAQCLTSAALLASGASAFASSTWVFGDNSPTTECGTSEARTSCAAQAGSDAGAPNVKVSAFSSTALSGTTFAAATLYSYGGGLGVQADGTISDTGSPQHATDNNGYTDLILLDFGSGNNFELEKVKIGWNGGYDSDISVFRYTGSSTTPTVVGLALTGLAAGGWQLVGNYANLVVGTDKSVNTSGDTSSWWLISAYNASYGGNTATNLGGTNDYFKVLSVAGSMVTPHHDNGVPEPGSLALMGAAMMGFVATRRRKQKSA